MQGPQTGDEDVLILYVVIVVKVADTEVSQVNTEFAGALNMPAVYVALEAEQTRGIAEIV